ncbi:MAG: aminotransferase class V-fold PLP-dependent enzyme, partial [Planctomycetaceae bacterium]|nr:aminotransferase class V-fold PLP-dependent enzyme [Planctomycetaceae bacterium]
MAAEPASRLVPTPDQGNSARPSAPVAADVACDRLGSPMERDRRPGTAPFDLEAVRKDFPAIHQVVRPGVPLIYLDSAATSLKPWPVIRAVQGYDAEYSANVHRGLHTLSERATEAYESVRARVAQFIGATDPAQVVFTRGTTESINLVAQSWGRTFLKPGDEVVVTLL